MGLFSACEVQPLDTEEIFVTPREQRSNFGFALWRARPRLMPEGHQHNEVEVNYLDRGRMAYIHGAGPERLDPGELIVFWAARPHRVTEVTADAFFYGWTLPLAWFLGWDIPHEFTRRVLQGEVIRLPQDPHTAEVPSRVERWIWDLAEDSAARRRVMLLEIEAWFHRAAISTASQEQSGPVADRRTKGPVHKVEQMARYMSEHYTETLSVREVAAHANLHPNYAVQLFRQTVGLTLVGFITRQRIAHAQLHLATTDARIIDIAMGAGFGSLSRFYAAFKREYGLSPQEYRAMVRAPRL